MSEQSKMALLWFIAAVALVWAVIAMVVNINQADSIINLQRRAATLKQRQ